MAHIEREQKFLVDFDEFSKLNLQNYKQIRQCYLSVERGGAFEVRLRETTPVVERVHLTATYTQTIRRRRQDDAIGRDEVEFAVHADDFEAAWSLSQWRLEKRRYAVDDWTVDVFTSGALKGVAVAEMELSGEHADVAAYLTATGQPWPAWVVQVCARCGKLACGVHRLEPATTKPVDLTSLSVNLVAAGVMPLPHTLRCYLDDLAAAKEARKLSAYTSAPRNRQGVVDLDKAAQRARRQQAKVGSFDPRTSHFGDPRKASKYE